MRTPRERSPYGLIQEDLRDQPWRLLVACIMLNLTSARQVRPVLDPFFRRWPDPSDMTGQDEMVEMLRPLGMQNRRVTRIVGMSWDYRMLDIPNNPDLVPQLHGVGKYAADSYRMFVVGEIVDDVQDKELKNYVRWARSSRVQPGQPDQGGHCTGDRPITGEVATEVKEVRQKV